MPDNPFQASSEKPEKLDSLSRSVDPDQAIYNVVVDTVTGVNARWSDNLFQAIFVFVSVVVVAALGRWISRAPLWNPCEWNLFDALSRWPPPQREARLGRASVCLTSRLVVLALRCSVQ
ncbi:MAG: hypothetical protein MUD03_11560 [Pirellula sp.]|nr:hypothetical protein [Pirellula sp.]